MTDTSQGLTTRRFAKVFDAGEYQLLVFIDATDENDDDHTALHQMTDIGGALLDITLRGPDRSMQAIFDAYGPEQASNFFQMQTVQNVVSAITANAEADQP